MGNTPNGAKVSPEGLPKAEKKKISKMWENFIKRFRKKKPGKSSLEKPAKLNYDEVELETKEEVETKEEEFAFPEICEYQQTDILQQLREEGILGAKNVTNRVGGLSFFVTTSEANVTQSRPRLLAKLDHKPSRTQSAPNTDFNVGDKMMVADILRQECLAKKIEKAQKCGKKRKKNLDKKERAQAVRAEELREKMEMKMIVADANRHGEIGKKKVAATKACASKGKGPDFKRDEPIEEAELKMTVADANRLEQEVKKRAKARKAIFRTAPSVNMAHSENL